MLTTLTTVLGLTPLLYEGSSQAQFLLPTVVTLVYGLSFGMVLVLVIVPALMAAQSDVSRNVAAAKRALAHPRRSGVVGYASVIAALGIVALFAATIGAAALLGTAVAPIAGMGLPPAVAFLALSAVWLVLIYALASVVAAVRMRKAAS